MREKQKHTATTTAAAAVKMQRTMWVEVLAWKNWKRNEEKWKQIPYTHIYSYVHRSNSYIFKQQQHRIALCALAFAFFVPSLSLKSLSVFCFLFIPIYPFSVLCFNTSNLISNPVVSWTKWARYRREGGQRENRKTTMMLFYCIWLKHFRVENHLLDAAAAAAFNISFSIILIFFGSCLLWKCNEFSTFFNKIQ